MNLCTPGTYFDSPSLTCLQCSNLCKHNTEYCTLLCPDFKTATTTQNVTPEEIISPNIGQLGIKENGSLHIPPLSIWNIVNGLGFLCLMLSVCLLCWRFAKLKKKYFSGNHYIKIQNNSMIAEKKERNKYINLIPKKSSTASSLTGSMQWDADAVVHSEQTKPGLLGGGGGRRGQGTRSGFQELKTTIEEESLSKTEEGLSICMNCNSHMSLPEAKIETEVKQTLHNGYEMSSTAESNPWRYESMKTTLKRQFPCVVDLGRGMDKRFHIYVNKSQSDGKDIQARLKEWDMFKKHGFEIKWMT